MEVNINEFEVLLKIACLLRAFQHILFCHCTPGLDELYIVHYYMF